MLLTCESEYAIYWTAATNYFEGRDFDYRRSISSVIFWFPDSVMGKKLEKPCLDHRVKLGKVLNYKDITLSVR